MDKSKLIKALPFLAPFILIIVLFFLIPAVLTAILAFTDMDFKLQWTFAGFKNFFTVLNDDVIPQVFSNTVVYVIFTCFINVVFGFILALLTTYFARENIGLFFRTIWLLPRLTPSVIYGLLWIWFLDPSQNGMLNKILVNILNLPAQSWLQDHPMKVIILANGMIGASFGMIVFSSAIKSIPGDYFKAALVDGASDWLIIKDIIIPALKWPIMFVTVWQVLSLMTSYEYILLITNGGPLFDSEVVSLYAYHKAFENFEFGYGSSISLVIVILGVIITLIMLKLFGYDKMMNPSKLEG